MEAIDDLIYALYDAAGSEDWREFRAQALGRVMEHVGAGSAAWWLRRVGVASDHGQMTQLPQRHVEAAMLAALPFKAGAPGVIQQPMGKTLAVAVQHPHRNGSLVSTVLFGYASGRRPPADAALQRSVGHMVDANTLSLRQFIRRDDWLHAMGRTSRGSAALVDADGAIHAASERFTALLGSETDAGQLSFVLPEDVLGDEGGEFVHGPLHVRVSRAGGLYLIYARQPLPLDSLSPREQEIARALGDGKTLKSISRQYGIAVSTVANHTTRIYRKLAIYRREDLIELVRKRPEPGRKVG